MNCENNELMRRIFHLRNGEEVQLVVFKPEPFDNEQDMACKYEVTGLSKKIERRVMGVDQMQCVLIALKVAAADICSSEEYKAGSLYWLEMGSADIGLPIG